MMLDSVLVPGEHDSAIIILSASSNPELRRVHVVESPDSIILEGQVSSFYMKQMAQESVRDCAAGRAIINRLEVCRS